MNMKQAVLVLASFFVLGIGYHSQAMKAEDPQLQYQSALDGFKVRLNALINRSYTEDKKIILEEKKIVLAEADNLKKDVERWKNVDVAGAKVLTADQKKFFADEAQKIIDIAKKAIPDYRQFIVDYTNELALRPFNVSTELAYRDDYDAIAKAVALKTRIDTWLAALPDNQKIALSFVVGMLTRKIVTYVPDLCQKRLNAFKTTIGEWTAIKNLNDLRQKTTLLKSAVERWKQEIFANKAILTSKIFTDDRRLYFDGEAQKLIQFLDSYFQYIKFVEDVVNAEKQDDIKVLEKIKGNLDTWISMVPAEQKASFDAGIAALLKRLVDYTMKLYKARFDDLAGRVAKATTIPELTELKTNITKWYDEMVKVSPVLTEAQKNDFATKTQKLSQAVGFTLEYLTIKSRVKDLDIKKMTEIEKRNIIAETTAIEQLQRDINQWGSKLSADQYAKQKNEIILLKTKVAENALKLYNAALKKFDTKIAVLLTSPDADNPIKVRSLINELASWRLMVQRSIIIADLQKKYFVAESYKRINLLNDIMQYSIFATQVAQLELIKNEGVVSNLGALKGSIEAWFARVAPERKIKLTSSVRDLVVRLCTHAHNILQAAVDRLLAYPDDPKNSQRSVTLKSLIQTWKVKVQVASTVLTSAQKNTFTLDLNKLIVILDAIIKYNEFRQQVTTIEYRTDSGALAAAKDLLTNMESWYANLPVTVQTKLSITVFKIRLSILITKQQDINAINQEYNQLPITYVANWYNKSITAEKTLALMRPKLNDLRNQANAMKSKLETLRTRVSASTLSEAQKNEKKVYLSTIIGEVEEYLKQHHILSDFVDEAFLYKVAYISGTTLPKKMQAFGLKVMLNGRISSWLTFSLGANAKLSSAQKSYFKAQGAIIVNTSLDKL